MSHVSPSHPSSLNQMIPLEGGAKPTLLAERIDKQLTLSVFCNPDGTLSGKVNHLLEVSLKGFPTTAIQTESELTNAIELLSNAAIFWKEGAIHFKQRLSGGGCTQSAERDTGMQLGLQNALGFNGLGLLCYEDRNYDKAIEHFSRALKIFQRINPGDNQNSATCFQNLGRAYHGAGNSVLAAENLAESVAMNIRMHGKDYPDNHDVISLVGTIYKDQGDLPFAIECFTNALRLEEIANGGPSTTGNNQSLLGFAYFAQENYALALEYFAKCIAIRRPFSSNSDPEMATALNYLGVCHTYLQNAPAAVAAFEEAYAIRKAAIGAQHPDTLAILANLNKTRGALPSTEDAEQLENAMRLNGLGTQSIAKGDNREAVQYFSQAIEAFRAHFNRDDPNLAIFLQNLGLAYQLLEDISSANKYFEENIAMDRRFHGAAYPGNLQTLRFLGSNYRNQEDYPRAIEYLTKALDQLKAEGGDQSILGNLYFGIGYSYTMQQKYPQGLKHLEQSVAIKRSIGEQTDSNMANALNYFGVCLSHVGRQSEAINALEEAYAIRKTLFGEEHSDTLETLRNINIIQSTPAEVPSYIQAAPSIDAPFPAYWSVPKKYEKFVGRESLLADIKKRFTASGQSPITQVAIAGLGGVGKTSLVLEYLYRNRGQYSTVWWISAEQPLSGFRDLGEALGIVKPTDEGDYVLKMVKEWLETQSGWLIVFDNVEDKNAVAPYIPSTGLGGHILTTSRNPYTKESLIVGVFSTEESVNLLTSLTEQNDPVNAEALANVLGHLPLALTQAGAYMHTTKTSLKDYLSLFGEVRSELWQDEKAPENYTATVGTTWNISVRRIQTDMPEALKVLDRSAYLAPDNIPLTLFKVGNQDPLVLNKCLHEIQKYSFFSPGQKEETYSVHRLVQATTRDNIALVEGKAFGILEGLLARIDEEWDFLYYKPETWAKAKLLQPHVLALATYGKNEQPFLPQLATLYNSVGNYNKAIDINLPVAIQCVTEALKMRISFFGEEHRLVAVCLNNLGVIYKVLGDLTTSLKYHEEALRIRKIVYPEGDSDVAISLNNIGEVYRVQKKFEAAAAAFTEALDVQKKASGEDSSNVAVILNNLGLVYEEQGEGLNQYTEALRISRKTYGENHFSVAACLNNLATHYTDIKDFTRAAAYLNESLKINKSLYGDEHPAVAINLNNLGEVSTKQGNAQEAMAFFSQALVIMEKNYGKESPEIVPSLQGLGLCHMMMGQMVAGMKYSTRCLNILKANYGETHPDVMLIQETISTLESSGLANEDISLDD